MKKTEEEDFRKDFNILIIDDEQSFVEMISKFLISEGFTSLYLTDPTKALKFIEKNKIKIVFIDLCMPEESGMLLLKKIKEYDSMIQCIMMTGYNSQLSFKASLKVHADDYLMKPFNLLELKNIVEYFVCKLKRWDEVQKTFF